MKHTLAMLATSACGSGRQLVRAGLKRPLLFLAAAVLGLMLGSVQSAEAATCNVPGTYPTIQMAVNDSSCDPIIVAAGLYLEQVTINRTLTLRGAQAGVDARTRPFVAANESIIDHPCGPVQIEADNIVLDGFTVQGSNLPPNLFPACFGAGIWMNPGFSGTNGGPKIRNNIVQANIMGIALNSTCNIPTMVQLNLIQNNNNPGPDAGNGIESIFGLCNATIESNKFSGHDNSSVRIFPPAGSNLGINNNELVGGSSERIVFAGVSNSTVNGNVSIGSTAVNGTIRLFGGNSNVAIEGNTLFNGVRGIRVDDPFGAGINSGVTAHFNCIQGNSIAGMEVDLGGHLGRLDAENNWWGSPSGPKEFPRHPTGMGDNIIDPDQNVDFDPWLNSCPGGAAPRIVNGGGQINVTGGVGSFGFSAKQATQSGHLDYLNHFTGTHLNCTVNSVTIISTTKAQLSGMCSSNTYTGGFVAEVEDNADPGKNKDTFQITYSMTDGAMETIRSGNIQIH